MAGNTTGAVDLSIQELLRMLLQNDAHSLICTVTEVNGLKCNCEPLNGDADVLEVRLIADESDEQYVLVPAVGSFVVITFLSRTDAYVSMVSKVSEVLYKIGETYYNVNADGFLIKKGDDSLKDVLQLIIDAVKQIVVFQGNNPDYVKLAEANTKLQNILR